MLREGTTNDRLIKAQFNLMMGSENGGDGASSPALSAPTTTRSSTAIASDRAADTGVALALRKSPPTLEPPTSFVSARDANFWVAVASASPASSFSSSASSSRVGSALDPRASMLDVALRRADFGLSIGVEEEDDEKEEEEGEGRGGKMVSNHYPSKDEVEPPMTSPPPPSEGLRRPTVLQQHRRNRDRLSSEHYRSSPSSTTSSAASPTLESKPAPLLPSPPPPPPIALAPVILPPSSIVPSIRQDDASGTPPFNMAVEEVYEHQRYQMVLGWGAKGHLLPLDPGKYVRIVRHPPTLTESRRRRPSLTSLSIGDDFQAMPSAIFPDVNLPETPDATSAKWEWISPWHLELPKSEDGATERNSDPDGWRYASSFTQFASWRDDASNDPTPTDVTSTSPQVNARGHPKLYVRRRKWARFRKLRRIQEDDAHHAMPGTVASSFDDSFLDSMCGWLRKLGHVRKNWKQRYFVLDKSVLRYYADEARTRLKGEVLLFHPATRVHYVDIHLSSGRDNTFAIQVGPEYSLLLQADRLSDRENWMYCIEDALLCRDSYLQDPMRTQDVRESVARRRKFSSESLLFSLATDSVPSVAPMSTLTFHANAVVQATRKNPLMMRLVVECDAYLESRDVKRQITTFTQKFRQKYGGGGSSGGSSAQATTPRSPASARRRSSDVSSIQDPRCLLALKNYRFFLERAMADAMDHLQRLAFVHASLEITSPRAVDTAVSTCETPSSLLAGDIDWELAKKAVLYKLERLTFIPLQETVYALLESTIDSEDLRQFEVNRAFLAGHPQRFFEIRASHLSPSNWKSACLLLDSMDDYSLPTEKASILLEVAKCIYDTYASEHALGEIQSMAADDFLPIFIFVLARSTLRNVVVARHLISETMISCVMIGETGYYATMFEAAMSYIAAFHLANELNGNDPATAATTG